MATVVTTNIHPDPAAIKARQSKATPTNVWLNFGDYPAEATVFVSSHEVIAALRSALDDAEQMLTEARGEPTKPLART